MSGFSPTILIVSWQLQIRAGTSGRPYSRRLSERAAQEPGEHPEAFGAIERIVRVAGVEDHLARVGEEVAELSPGGAVDDLLG